MISDRSTYAHRERVSKVLLRKLLAAEAQRWKSRQSRISRARPTVATRLEASLVEDELALIAQAREWVDAATIPRRIR